MVGYYARMLPIADDAHEFFLTLRKGWATNLEPPALVRWAVLYRRSRGLRRVLFTIIFGDKIAHQIHRGELSDLPKAEKLEILEAGFKAWIENPNATADKNILEITANNPQANAQAQMVIQWVAYYFGAIQLPCLFLHDECPSLILRKARQGDLEALDQLIRIDKVIILSDPKLKIIWHYLMTKGDADTRNKILKAMAGSPIPKLTLAQIKLRIGAMIKLISQKIEFKIPNNHLNELFIAVAKDRGERGYGNEVPYDAETLTRKINLQLQKLNAAFDQFDVKD